MASTFPNLIPDFINIQLSEFQKNKQEFATSDFYVQNYQQLPIGYVLEVKFTNMSKWNSDIVVTFYHTTKQKVFVLPSNFLSRFPTSFVSTLNLQPYWMFEGEIQLDPKIVNGYQFLSELTLKIKNVWS
jgi:hypothetical protein